MSKVKNYINVAIGRVKTDLPVNAGICIGIIAGTALKDIGLGLCLGVCAGLAAAPASEVSKAGKKDSRNKGNCKFCFRMIYLR